MAQGEEDVYLAVYDLSQGMARGLSAQFLGPDHAIDMIPHTGLLVFGKEYFFGGGIQAVEPHEFRRLRGLHPVLTQRLGSTRVTMEAFEAWCLRSGSRYNAHTYDLLQRNCNHFSHEAALQALGLSEGVPHWILDVPQRFMSSPMGQIVRPMLERMQITQAPPVTSTMGTIGNTNAAGNLPVLNVPPPAPSVSAAYNPWANMPPSGTTTINTTKNTPSSESTSLAVNEATPKTTATPTVAPSSQPVLKKFTKPMLSKDTKALHLCTQKLSPHLANDRAREAMDELSQSGLTQRRSTVRRASSDGSSVSSESSVSSSHSVSSNSSPTTSRPSSPSRSRRRRRGDCVDNSDACYLDTLVDAVVPELWRLIEEGTMVSFALLYLRLVVLRFARATAVEKCMVNQMIPALLLPHPVPPHTAPQSDDPDFDEEEAEAARMASVFQTPASRSLAWCVMSNYAGASAWIPTTVVEAAIRDWSDEAVQVRQAACTFLYNYVVCNGPKLDQDEETLVSLLCSSLETLVEETDPTTRLRRLVVGARVVFGVHRTTRGSNHDDRHTHHKRQRNRYENGSGSPRSSFSAAPDSEPVTSDDFLEYNEMAKDLVRDLGFVGLLQEMAATDYSALSPGGDCNQDHPDAKECQTLAFELIEQFR